MKDGEIGSAASGPVQGVFADYVRETGLHVQTLPRPRSVQS